MFYSIFSTDCNVLKPSRLRRHLWELGVSGRRGFLHFSPSLPRSFFPPFFSFSFLFSQELETIRGRELDKEAQLKSREEPSILSGFHHVESEKTQEPLDLIELILEDFDFDELWRRALIYSAEGEVARGATVFMDSLVRAWDLEATDPTTPDAREGAGKFQESGPRRAGVSGIWEEASGKSMEVRGGWATGFAGLCAESKRRAPAQKY